MENRWTDEQSNKSKVKQWAKQIPSQTRCQIYIRMGTKRKHKND